MACMAPAAELLASLAIGLPATRDLTSTAEAEQILKLSTTIVDSGNVGTISDFANLHPELPALLLAACKNAESFEALRESPACHLTVIFPMYHEQNRARPKSEHMNGQDFVRVKCKQLDWLFEGSPGSSWDLVAVDDGCDQGSRKTVEAIIAQDKLSDRVRTVALQTAIDAKIPMFGALRTCRDSRKGGAVLYGLYDTAQRLRTDKPHLVMYTDSDLSADLAMSGKLVGLCLTNGSKIGAGVRYGYPGSFLVKRDGAEGHPESHLRKPDCVHVTLRHFVRARLLPQIAHLYDTNCGFKCFNCADLLELLPNCSLFGPAFDMQLVLVALRHYRDTGVGATACIATAPILFVEDYAESNFTSNDTDPDATAKSFFRMDQEICKMCDEFTPKSDLTADALELKQLLEGWTLEQYKGAVAKIEATLGRALLFDVDIPMSVFR